MSFTASIEDIVRRNEGGMLGSAPHWPRMKLSQFAEIKNGEPLPAEGFNGEAGPPVVRIRNILDGDTSTRFRGKFDEAWFIEPGDLLVGMDGDFNAQRWTGPRALLNQRVCRVKPKSDSHVSIEYLAHILPGYLKALNRNTPSITVKHLSSKTLADLPIPVPAPAEQALLVQTLGAHITRIDTAEADLRRAKANVKRARAAVLKAAVEGRLVPTEAELARAEGRDFEPAAALLKRVLAERKAAWAKMGRGKYLEPVAPDTAGLPELPEGWCSCSFDQVFWAVSDQGKKLQRKAYLPEGKWPVVDQGDSFIGGFTDRSDVVYSGSLPVIAFGDHTRRFKLLEFQFVVGADGVKLIGITSAWNARFALVALQTLRFEDRGYSRHFQFVRNGVLRLPPLAEQARIVAEVDRRMSQLTAVETALDANLARCAKARQSVLKMAFEGRLVPQAQTTTTTARYLAASLAYGRF